MKKKLIPILPAFAASLAFATIGVNPDTTYTINNETISDNFRIANGQEGTVAILELTGTGKLYGTSDSEIACYSNTGWTGKSILRITGENNLFAMENKDTGAVNGSVYLGCKAVEGLDAQFLVSGANNEVRIGSYVQGQNGAAGANTLFSITGSNNVLNFTGFRNHFRLAWRGASTGGTNTVYFKGDGAEANKRVYFNTHATSNTAATIDLGGANGTNDVHNNFILDGNATLRGTETEGAFVTLNSTNSENQTAYGVHRFEINNSGNQVHLSTLNLGNASQVSGSTSTFSVSGSGSDINIDILNVNGAAGTSKSDIKGGAMEFVFNSDSISTVNATKINAFSGVLVLDFSRFNGVAGQAYEYDLLSSTNDWSSIWNNFGWSDDTGSDRVLFLGDGDLSLSYAGGTLSAIYTAIPEPSTYAAIFGALALAFAAYRRRK